MLSIDLRPSTRYGLKRARFRRLVEADDDVTLDAGSQVDLSLEVELDADEESSALLRTGIVGGTLQELACRSSLVKHSEVETRMSQSLTSRLREAGRGGQRNNELLLLTAAAATSLTVGVRVGGVGGLSEAVDVQVLAIVVFKLIAQAVNDLTWAQREQEQEQQEQEEKEAGQWGSQRQEGEC